MWLSLEELQCWIFFGIGLIAALLMLPFCLLFDSDGESYARVVEEQNRRLDVYG